MTNHLDTWMAANDRDDRWLAQAIGCSPSQAWRIRNRKNRPSPTRAFEIERITKGKVKASFLLTAEIVADEAKAA